MKLPLPMSSPPRRRRVNSRTFSSSRPAWPAGRYFKYALGEIVLVVLGILIALGFWQLDRATQKRILLAGYSVDPNATVVQLEPDLQSATDLRYQFASATGYYDARHQFLLDNRTSHGRAGYHVLTPFKLRESQVAVLVNRGWIPKTFGAGDLPAVDVATVLFVVKVKATGDLPVPKSGIAMSISAPTKCLPPLRVTLALTSKAYPIAQPRR